LAIGHSRSNEIEQSYILDESHKLDLCPLYEGPRPKSGNQGETYMAPFWMENQLVQTKKQGLKGELMV